MFLFIFSFLKNEPIILLCEANKLLFLKGKQKQRNRNFILVN